MKKLRNLCVVGIVLFLAYTLSEITDIPSQDNTAYAVIIDPVTGELVEVTQEQASLVSTDPTFTRGHTTQSPIPWQQMPCRNTRTGETYQSDILSFAEIEWNLVKVGFTPPNAHTMAAIAHQESGHQISCSGDENLVDNIWTDSYGIFQIRGLHSETGKGTCRDIKALGTDILKQAQCAYEISGGGTNFRPWSMYLNGKYKESL